MYAFLAFAAPSLDAEENEKEEKKNIHTKYILKIFIEKLSKRFLFVRFQEFSTF